MSTRIILNEMVYFVFQTSENSWEVEDQGGVRPLGLRDCGPFQTREAAEAAIRQMDPEEARE